MPSARSGKSRLKSEEKRTAEQSAELIAKFYKDHGYLPTQRTPSSGEHKRLALVLERLRRLKAAGDLPEDAARILDQAYPKWTARADHAGERWQRTAEDFIAWVKQNGRFPSASSDDEAERFLSRWLFRQRHDARRERFPARVRELDARLPEWRETFSEQERRSYVESAQQIAAYVQEHGTLPAPDGKSGSEAERLAGVLLVLRNQQRRGLLAKEAIQTLNAAFPGWLDGITLNVERHWQNVPPNSSNGSRRTEGTRTAAPGTRKNGHWPVGSPDNGSMQRSANTLIASGNSTHVCPKGTAHPRPGRHRQGYLSAQRSCAAWRLIPAARPMSVQEAPAAFAAATVLSRRCPA